jgi:hypothetical protein
VAARVAAPDDHSEPQPAPQRTRIVAEHST